MKTYTVAQIRKKMREYLEEVPDRFIGASTLELDELAEQQLNYFLKFLGSSEPVNKTGHALGWNE